MTRRHDVSRRASLSPGRQWMRVCTILAAQVLLSGGLAWSQISPGALSAAHSFLDGPTHCTSCHDLAKRPPEYKCLECHQEIRKRLDEKRGLHPSLVGGDRTGRSCVTCHSEHNGKDFPLIHWDGPLPKFDHHRTGYTLEGRHAALACKTCHQPERISIASTGPIAMKDLSRTWLGLPARCIGCHADEHRGQLSTDCERCHDSSQWRNAAQFNHDRARFALAGAHTKVACQKCHTKAGDPKPYTKFRGLPFAACAPCHNDPHRGSFRQSCQDCHSSTIWKPLQVTTAFNHSTTNYPLEGKHQSLACSPCHLTSNFKAPVLHARCADCHRKDPHRGQFAQREGGGDCAGCHKVDGFKPSTFTAARHSTTGFALVEKHAGVLCVKCHVPKGEATVYRFESEACSACHADVHKGQFRSAPYDNKCDSCHSVKGFTPTTFTLARHAKTQFPLSGAHAAVMCIDCHKSPANIHPPPPAPFHFKSHGCSDCHADPHKGELAERMTDVRADGAIKGCEACHTPRAWKEISGFDHATTLFPLEGAHRAVACESCHKSRTLQAGMKNISFKSAPRVCSGCHEDIHAGQFSNRAGPADCSLCHRLGKWRPSTFDHETSSDFHLAGAHKNVTCALCHQTRKEISGKMVVMYKPTARDCRACHGNLATAN